MYIIYILIIFNYIWKIIFYNINKTLINIKCICDKIHKLIKLLN